MPDKLPILDIASLVFAVVFGIPQTILALKGARPGNLRVLALLLGIAALLTGIAAVVHLSGGPAIARAALLAAAAGAGIGWIFVLLSLVRHNTTM